MRLLAVFLRQGDCHRCLLRLGCAVAVAVIDAVKVVCGCCQRACACFYIFALLWSWFTLQIYGSCCGVFHVHACRLISWFCIAVFAVWKTNVNTSWLQAITDQLLAVSSCPGDCFRFAHCLSLVYADVSTNPAWVASGCCQGACVFIRAGVVVMLMYVAFVWFMSWGLSCACLSCTFQIVRCSHSLMERQHAIPLSCKRL